MRPKFDADKYRNQPKMMAEYLNDAFGTRDSAIIAMAIGDMARVHGMSELSRESGIALSCLYKSRRDHAEA
jgi:probable addiction module antidote protein